VDGEADTAALLVVECRARGDDVLRIRVERVDGAGTCGREGGQAARAAADVEHALVVERDEAGDRRRLDTVLVAPLHRLCVWLVRLQGRSARAELQRFAPGVLELGARVGVDELSGLDPLEAVSF
jgi:hypothetical protein